MRIGIIASMQFTDRMVEVRDELIRLGHDAFITSLHTSLVKKNAEEIEEIKLYQKRNLDAIRAFWRDILQKELNTRWGIFDTKLEGVTGEWKKSKATHMEITEARNKVSIREKQFDRSLTSLGNILDKVTTHETGMWEIRLGSIGLAVDLLDDKSKEIVKRRIIAK